MRTRCVAVATLALVSLAAGAACADPESLPGREPDSEGVIASVHDNVLFIEHSPGSGSGFLFTIDGSTRILTSRPDGTWRRGGPQHLRVGFPALGWANGFIMESDPAQALAGVIALP